VLVVRLLRTGIDSATQVGTLRTETLLRCSR